MIHFKEGDYAYISLGWLGCPSDIVKCQVLSCAEGRCDIITLETCSLGLAGYTTNCDVESLLKHRGKLEEEIAEFKEFQRAVDWFGRAMNSSSGVTLGVGKGYAVMDKDDKVLGRGNDPSNAIFRAYKNRKEVK